MPTDTGEHTEASSAAAAQRSNTSVWRFATAIAAGPAAAFGAALLDAHWAFHSAATPPGSRLELLLLDAGVLVPITTALGVGVAVAVAVLAPRPLPTARDVVRATGASLRAHGGTMAAALVASFVALVALAHVARRVMIHVADPRATGAVLALAAVALFSGAVLFAQEAGRVLRTAGSRVPGPALVALGLAFVGAAGTFGILHGTTNGDGGFLEILGVLRREELDLRAPALLLAVAAGIAAVPFLFRHPKIVTLAVILLPCGATYHAAVSPALSRRALSLAIERGAPLGSRGLAVLRRVTDRDHDGVSARFGGGDCDDHDRKRFPGADDVPGNGLDEDCSGSDERFVAPAPVTTAPPSGEPGAHFPGDLSLVFVTVDTLRADLGFAGNPRPVSPNLDALAARSVVFDRAYSLASYTGKSIGPMLLGKYPSETLRSFSHFDKFQPEETFVQERLQRAGIRTLTAQGHWYFKADTGIGTGFDDADYSASPRVPQAEGDRTVNGDKVTDAALALLRRPENTRGRFYLWMHYLDPHAEYVPHPEYDFGRKGRDLYDGEVLFVDAQIGRLLSYLKESGLEGRTAVVVTSDHGEAFGEHGMYRHGFEVWEELVHVPLVWFVPGVAPRHVAARRSAVDLVPTILDFFGAPAPSGQGTDFLSGRSLADDIVDGQGHATPERPVMVDMSEGPYNEERQAFIDGNMKLVTSRGRTLGLYDLGTDPGEKKDLSDDAGRLEPILAKFKAARRGMRVHAPAR